MTNAILKRLTQRGMIAVRKLNSRNVHYAVTPAGVNEIAKRSYRYFKRTIRNVVFYRDRIDEAVARAKVRGAQAVLLIGVSDLDFIVEHSCDRHGLPFLKAIDAGVAKAARGDKVLSIFSEGIDPPEPGIGSDDLFLSTILSGNGSSMTPTILRFYSIGRPSAGASGHGASDQGREGPAVCDSNTEGFARRLGGAAAPRCALPRERGQRVALGGSDSRPASRRALGRDDFRMRRRSVVHRWLPSRLSVYMQVARLVLVPTTLLAMADAAWAERRLRPVRIEESDRHLPSRRGVHMATEALGSPCRGESGFRPGEVIKTAVIAPRPMVSGNRGRQPRLGPSDPETSRFLPELVARCERSKAGS
jgi:hypothetical protein